MKKLTAILLCALLLVGVPAGCSRPAPTPTQKAQPSPAPASDGAYTLADSAPEGICFRQTPLPDTVSDFTAQCVWNDRVYSASNLPLAFGWADAAGNTGAPELPSDTEYLFDVCPAGSSIALLTGTPPAAYQAEEASVYRYEICLYDENDVLTGRIPLNTEQTDFRGLAWLDGTFYLLLWQQVLALDEAGNTTAAFSLDDGSLLQLLSAGDSLWVCASGGGYAPQTLLRLDASLQELGRYDVDGLNVQGLGADADGALLLLTPSDVLRPDFDTGRITRLLSWKDNLNLSSSNYSLLYGTEGGYFACGNYLEPACWFERLPEGQTLAEPEEITVFTFGPYELALQTWAADFMQRYPQYRVVIEQPAMEGDETGMQYFDSEQLVERTELSTGAGADLYHFPSDSTAWADLDDSQVFVDLLPFLRGVDGLLDDTVPCVQKALTGSSALYRAPLGYGIVTMAADAEVVTDHTPAGILTACRAAGADATPFDWVDGIYLTLMAQTCARDYVDTASWTCHFTDDSFLDQLRVLKLQMPDGVPEISESITMQPNGLLGYYSIYAPRAIQYAPAAWGRPALDSYVYAGYPSVSESRGQLYFSSLLALNANSEHKEAAQAFLRYLFSEDAQITESGNSMLPIRDSALRACFPALIEAGALTQEDIDKFYALTDALEPMLYPSATVEEIIQEETTTYLSGGADETLTAERIQSRVSLWLREQHG